MMTTMYFKKSQEGADSMSDVVEEYFRKRIAAEMDEQMTKTARLFLQNGASVELVRKSIPTLSADAIEELSEQAMMSAK